MNFTTMLVSSRPWPGSPPSVTRLNWNKIKLAQETHSSSPAELSLQLSLLTGVRRLEREVLPMVSFGLKVFTTLKRSRRMTISLGTGPTMPGLIKLVSSTSVEDPCSSPGTITMVSSQMLRPSVDTIARWISLWTHKWSHKVVIWPCLLVFGSIWHHKTPSLVCTISWLATLSLTRSIIRTTWEPPSPQVSMWSTVVSNVARAWALTKLKREVNTSSSGSISLTCQLRVIWTAEISPLNGRLEVHRTSRCTLTRTGQVAISVSS